MDSASPSTLSRNFHLFNCIPPSQSCKDGKRLKLCVKFSHSPSLSVVRCVNGCRPTKSHLQSLYGTETLPAYQSQFAVVYLIQFHLF